MTRPRMLALVAALSLMIVAVPVAQVSAQDGSSAPTAPEATPNPVALDTPAGDGTAVRLTTELGDIVIGLFTESAPVAAENFLNLATAGFYDGVGFHRVVPGFVVQGGDPEGTGRGVAGYTIQDEQVVGEYGRGIVAMARTQAPNSQGSQFFFVLDDSARAALEAARTYVIFGRVVDGMDVVDEIVEAREPSDLIEDPVRIISASVEQVELPPEPTPPPPSASELNAEALAASLPAQVGGQPLTVNRFTSEAILGGAPGSGAAAELTDLAEANGGDIADLAIVTASFETSSSFAVILAASIPGVEAALVQDALAGIVLGGTGDAEVSDVSLAGRAASKIVRGDSERAEDTVYVISSGDVLYFVVAAEGSLEEVVAALP